MAHQEPHGDTSGTSFAAPKVLDFLAALNHDTDLVAVLRGHLYVEALLTAIISTKYVGSEPVINWLDFMRKVKVARDNGLIEGGDKRALQALGHVRDSFAHLPIKPALTRDDDATIQKALPDLMNSRYYVFIRPLIEQDPNRPGLIVRAGIGMIYDHMAHRLAGGSS